MQELIWFVEPFHVLMTGGDWDAALATEGFKRLALLIAFLVPPTVIALGIGSEWRETPLGLWFGGRRRDEDNWTDRAADLDGDGHPDF